MTRVAWNPDSCCKTSRNLTFRIISLASMMFLNPVSFPGSISTWMVDQVYIHKETACKNNTTGLQETVLFFSREMLRITSSVLLQAHLPANTKTQQDHTAPEQVERERGMGVNVSYQYHCCWRNLLCLTLGDIVWSEHRRLLLCSVS